jgi:hypothetical protein
MHLNKRPRAYGQGIITHPRKPKQSLAKRIAEPLAAAAWLITQLL